MAGSVLVFAEQRDGKLKKSALEVLGLAQDLAAGGAVEALVLGHGIDGVVQEVGRHGAKKIWMGDDPSLALVSPEAYVSQIYRTCQAAQPDLILFAATSMGRDLAPRVAARGGYGFLS